MKKTIMPLLRKGRTGMMKCEDEEDEDEDGGQG